MAGEIASAFVRIRPNMAGFKTETEGGVRSAFSGLAKIAGIALGAGAAFEFGKSAVSGAAQLQKQVETINAEFGAAGKNIKIFGEQGATAFGISAQLADATSARFGILFKNLGIGQQVGANMTIGLEKLAGSLSAIRGVDPSTVLARLPLALAGNTRGLKQLGLGIDATQIKYAAFKLGLISTINQAITPAIKAQAIYALATANLPAFLDQAKKHSGDLANVTLRLRAEWTNAKDTLGKALLPAITKVATALEGWLSKMQKSGALQRDFNAVGRVTVTVFHLVGQAFTVLKSVLDPVVKAVGGLKDAFLLLLVAMAVNKIVGIARAFGTTLVGSIQQARIQFSLAKLEYASGTSVMKLATITLGATIKSALISGGIGLLIIAVSFAVTYIITHWAQVKRYTVALGEAIVAVWQGLKTTLIGIAEVIGGAMTTYLTAPLRALLKVAGFLGGIFDTVFGTNISGSLKKADSFIAKYSTGLVSRGARNVKDGVTKGFHDAATAWSNALDKGSNTPAFNDHLTKVGKNAASVFQKAVNDNVANGVSGLGAAVSTAMQSAIAAANQKIQAAVIASKTNLDKIGGKLADTIQKIIGQLGGVPGAIAGSPQGAAFQKLKDLISSGAPSFKIARASAELQSQLKNVGKGLQPGSVKSQIANLTDEFNKGAIGLGTFNKKVNAVLAANNANYKTAGKAGGKAFSDAFAGELRALHLQASAIAALPARLRGVGGGGADAGALKIIRPLEVIREQDARLAATASKERARIAKAAEKTASTLQTLKNTKIGVGPGFGNTPPGHAAHNATKAAKSKVQP